MEYTNPLKPVTNPMLVGTLELLAEAPTDEHRKLFIKEVLKAKFLSPVVVKPEPQYTDDGKVVFPPDSQVHFPLLRTTEGESYLMAFTDQQEMFKGGNEGHKHSYTLDLEDFARMLLKKSDSGKSNPARGFVINPYGKSLVVTREMLAGFLMLKRPKK